MSEPDDTSYRPRRVVPPAPPPYEPLPPDPVEAQQVAEIEARGDRPAGEKLP